MISAGLPDDPEPAAGAEPDAAAAPVNVAAPAHVVAAMLRGAGPERPLRTFRKSRRNIAAKWLPTPETFDAAHWPGWRMVENAEAGAHHPVSACDLLVLAYQIKWADGSVTVEPSVNVGGTEDAFAQATRKMSTDLWRRYWGPELSQLLLPHLAVVRERRRGEERPGDADEEQAGNVPPNRQAAECQSVMPLIRTRWAQSGSHWTMEPIAHLADGRQGVEDALSAMRDADWATHWGAVSGALRRKLEALFS